MEWFALGLGVLLCLAANDAIKLRRSLKETESILKVVEKDYELYKNSFRDINDELNIAQADYEEAQEAIGVWKDRYLEAVNVHSLLADEREQSIGDRHDLVILGDQDMFVAYYHGELVVGQKRMSFNGYEDDTYRFEVTFGNTKDEGNVIYFGGEDYE